MDVNRMISCQEWAGQESDRSSPGEEDEEVTSDWNDPNDVSNKETNKVTKWVHPGSEVSTEIGEIVD